MLKLRCAIMSTSYQVNELLRWQAIESVSYQCHALALSKAREL